MIQLRRPPGRFARVGHRGAAALASENTLRSLELAVELGCDMVELDVLRLPDGTPVVGHPREWPVLRIGAASGRSRRRPREWLRRVASELPTLDDALAQVSQRFPHVGLQLDLKRRGVEREVVEVLRRHGLTERSWISSFDPVALHRMAELEPELPRAYTLPRGRLGISRRGPLAPLWRGGLASIGASLPRRLPGLLQRARASAATLHYSVASAGAIRRAHDVGAAVYVWTVDDPRRAQRLVDAGADGIITNDPRIFASLKT
jgi:glycerophosphoryl diester phosphodiesterase